MSRPSILIVTPALAAANNGNWQTARRWARLLAADYRVTLGDRWAGDEHETAVAMIALHARRSAPSIAAWRARFPTRPLAVVLTGTDLYRDIISDAAAQRSLQLADRLVVLQGLGVASLPPAHRAKAVVCLQSSVFRGQPRPLLTRPAAPSPSPRLRAMRGMRALMVGHLRDEKCPQTYFAAALLLAGRPDIVLDHIGQALDPALGEQAVHTAATCPNYHWLGGLPHGQTLRHIRAADVLVHASRMEGGAHVVIEAVVRGTPVLASRIDGNVGLLGEDYGGYFPVGDAAALAALLQRCRDEPTMRDGLQAQIALRAPLFAPHHERQTLRELLAGLLAPSPTALRRQAP